MRISATTIESFRLWSDPEQDWMPEEELVATIKGELTPTPRMLLGQAFGRCLERPGKYRTDDGRYRVPVKCGDRWIGYFFTDAVMDPCLDIFDRRGVFEAKATKQYGEHIVVSKADQILGTRIIENKTKLSNFDFDKYAESYQWRFMADMFEPSAVTYNVFCLSEDAKGGFELKSIETFNLYPYAELHQDCVGLLGRFVEYVKSRNLEGYLVERVYGSAAGNPASGDKPTLVKETSPQAAGITS